MTLKKEIKSRFPIVYKSIKYMDRYFPKRFKFEVMKRFGKLHVLSSADDRLLRRVAKEADAYVKEHKIAFGRKMLYPTSYLHVHFNRVIDFIFPIALKLRGVEIIPVLCNGFHSKQCPVFAGAFLDNFKHQCAACCDHPAHMIWEDILGYKPLMLTSYRRFQDLKIAREAIAGINHKNYSQYTFHGFDVGEQSYEMVANNNNLGRLLPGEPYASELNMHAMNAVEMVLAYERLLKEVRPDVCFGSYHDHYQWSSLYHVTRDQGLSYYSYTMIDKDGCVYIGRNVSMTCEVSGAWGIFKDIPVEEAIWQKFDNLMSEKSKGKTTCFDVYPSAGGKGFQELKAKLDPAKPIAYFPCNVTWDNAIHNHCFAANDIIDLIHKVVRFFNRHPEFQLIIKAHPFESNFYNSFSFLPHTVKNIIADLNEPIGKNIFFIDADSTISAFDIYPIAGLEIIHSSRSGCEMAMYGKPVLLTGANHYRGKGFTIDITSEKDLYQKMEHILRHGDTREDAARRIEVSRKYWLLYNLYGFINLGLFRGGWTRPAELLFKGIEDFFPGRNRKLDYICDSVINNLEVFGDGRWPPLIQ